jgi:hypothetical protein
MADQLRRQAERIDEALSPAAAVNRVDALQMEGDER